MESLLIAPQLQCVTDFRAQLGEGPIWVADRDSVFFVDIAGGNLHRFRPQGFALKTWRAPARPVFVVPTDGSVLLVGLEDGLCLFDDVEGTFHRIQAVPAAPGDRTRLNDACVDAHGRLWFGTMDEDEKSGKGQLYCFSSASDGYRLEVLDQNFIVANGPTVSPDGTHLYVSDTPRGVIYRHALSTDGQLSEKRVFARLANGEGGPDGIVCDIEGRVWASCWGGSKVIVFNPQGARLFEIPLPSPNVTKIAFTGADLSTLFVTSARQGLSDEICRRHPQAGGIFLGKTSYKGMVERPFRLHRAA